MNFSVSFLILIIMVLLLPMPAYGQVILKHREAPPPPISCYPPGLTCCTAVATDYSLEIGDAYLVSSGTTIPVHYPYFSCQNCRQPNCGLCDTNFPPRVCDAGLGITVSTSATASIRAGLSAEIRELVEASLGAELGVTIGYSETTNVECPIPTLPCENLKARVTVNIVIGRKAAVDHNWSITGVWQSEGILSGCGPGTCPNQGQTWHDACQTSPSTGRAHIESFICESPVDDDVACELICRPGG